MKNKKPVKPARLVFLEIDEMTGLLDDEQRERLKKLRDQYERDLDKWTDLEIDRMRGKE